jgi:hypothetical protein
MRDEGPNSRYFFLSPFALLLVRSAAARDPPGKKQREEH